jgi:ZIP family zinc transporter
MGEAAFYGFVGASALIIAAEVAFAFNLRREVVGLIMAFGVGALISSLSFELVLPSLEVAPTAEVALGLLLGSLAFLAGDWAISRMGGSGRKNPEGEKEGSSLGIVLGTVLDGIPESAVLGMSIATGAGVSVSFLAAIWISNFPESLGSTVGLEKSGSSRLRIRLMWGAIVLISVISSALGFAIADSVSAVNGALIQSFAAGALLTMIANEMAPAGFRRGGLLAGLATTLGFILAVWLTTFD